MNENSSTLNASADAGAPRTPLASTFSRPAALIGGAVGLVLLTAAATTLMVRSPASKDVADSHGATAAALVSDGKSLKSSGSVVPQAPADFPEKMEPKAEAKPEPAQATSAKPAPVAGTKGSTPTPSAKAGGATPQRAVASTCANCGVIEAVTPFRKKGEGTGVGAVGGAVVGGLLGNTMGGGDGRKAMTVIGAVGGGVAGNAIEKNARATTLYSVRVRMSDGTTRTITQSTAPAVGQKVTVEGSQLKARA